MTVPHMELVPILRMKSIPKRERCAFADKVEPCSSGILGHLWLRNCATAPGSCWSLHLAGSSVFGDMERIPHRAAGDCHWHDSFILCWEEVLETED